jgi:hypothetical protein
VQKEHRVQGVRKERKECTRIECKKCGRGAQRVQKEHRVQEVQKERKEFKKNRECKVS